MWRERRFEIETRKALEVVHDGTELWAKYQHTREDLVKHILPYIATQVPDLSDHGVDHIGNVIDNIGQVLGMNGSGQLPAGAIAATIPAHERLLLLMGALLHDVGNILGRNQHNLVTDEVWRGSGNASHGRWAPVDRRTIIKLCQAHTGKGPDGSDDTLRPLTGGDHYFLNDAVPLAKLAATLRFADELAEGSQRTSRFLLFQGLYGADSVDFHRYANATHVIIDRAGGRIALNYDIEVDERHYGDGLQLRENLSRLVGLIFKRILKLEKERVYARHYAPDWLAFSETSVLINIERDGIRLHSPQPLLLNDFNLREDSIAQFARLNPDYDIDVILGHACPTTEAPDR